MTLTFSATIESAATGTLLLRERSAQPPADPLSLPRAVLAVGTDVVVTLRPEGEPTESLARVCVAALVTDPTDRLLLVRSGKVGRRWELPGGKVRAGETWGDALRREVREEAGLGITLLTVPPLVLDGAPVTGAAFTSIILVARASAHGQPTAGDDAADARWFTAHEVPLGELSEFASTRLVREWALEASR